MQQLRLVHLSDPHFAHATFGLTQFFSKRWIGNLNLLLNRQRLHRTAPLWNLPQLFDALHVEHVMLTGDLATTALEEEFREGAKFVSTFKMPLHTLPGNHDAYTFEAERSQAFYRYFPERDLQRSRITKVALGKGWWWVGLDCAVATPCFKSYGVFFSEMEKTLRQSLSSIPSTDGVILGNHFPLFGAGRPRHDLARHGSLQAIIREYPQIKLYLHGHDHAPYHKKVEGLPHVLNAGSCSYWPGGSFYLIDIDAQGFTLEIYQCDKQGVWASIKSKAPFSF